ncbi:MAG: phytanoyl-CoA dioxygenase family protein [Leptolyngbyaceae cyanobacterium MAG.088]|nr:phytanoyl-CoA dioxygenase family protein [Leptolyngbyaceae cyanobacterium MAG.088]
MSYKLTADQVASFHENGFIGPFKLCSPEEMAVIRQQIEKEVINTPSSVYGFEKCPRDRHLDSRIVYDLFTHPTVRDRLTSLLGPDLLIWRSSFFFKPPGAPATVWHRANVFKEYVDNPILETNEPDNLFQLTTWIALDEATMENGCVQFIKGSHKEYYKTVITKPDDQLQNFGNDKKGLMGYDVQVDFDLDESRLVNMECQPGEFFIFDQRTLHGSPPNASAKRRMGVNFRAVQPHVKAYGHFLEDGKIEHFGRSWDLSRWGCILLSGKDTSGVNKIAELPSGKGLGDLLQAPIAAS